jgi:hypothetical protein
LKKKSGCKISQEMAEIEEKSKEIRASKFRTVEPAVLSSTRATSRVLKVGVKFAHCYHVPVVGTFGVGTFGKPNHKFRCCTGLQRQQQLQSCTGLQSQQKLQTYQQLKESLETVFSDPVLTQPLAESKWSTLAHCQHQVSRRQKVEVLLSTLVCQVGKACTQL